MKELYFIAIVIPEPWQKLITDLKLSMKEKFGSSHALKLPAHITLVAPFRTGVDLMTIISGIDNVANKFDPFNVRLKDFGFFKHGRTRVLYAAIENGNPLAKLHNDLEQFQRTIEGNSRTGENRKFHPHVTIASRDLRKDQFNDAMIWLNSNKLEAEIPVTGFRLFMQKGNAWTVAAVFKFSHLSYN